ncbi:hypothetical protein N9H30_00280 [bacterium]|nr:hypothetical protein [bacterium]|tara:strand:+ start:168 stop:662 length:495 start_codon:yes stop_codon:yes gene_type:complete
MSKHITSKGKVIDMESVIAQQGDAVAIGNMRVNAKGDLLGPGGKIIKTADERAREHYKNSDSSVDNAVSVKSTQPITADPGVSGGPEPKTAKTAKAEKKIQPDPEPVVEKQQEEIDPEVAVKTAIAKNKAQAQSKEPIGYKEVELPNGDIEMVPIFDDDWEDDE